MLLARFTPPGSLDPLEGEVRDGRAVAFADGSTILSRLTTTNLAAADGESWPLDEVTLHAPIARPRIIFCVGLNYQAHRDEGGADQLTGPDVPIIFLKPDSCSTDPNGTVSLPKVIQKLDYEGEMVAVMGADGNVGGYAIGNDLSAREIQLAEMQWTRGKGFDNSCPWGPWITTADAVHNPQGLQLRTFVNGDLRQDANTADMIFDIPTIVSFISETCTLQPGDVIMTGTPSGVAMARGDEFLLKPGDTVRVEIVGLGSIEHHIGEPF